MVKLEIKTTRVTEGASSFVTTPERRRTSTTIRALRLLNLTTLSIPRILTDDVRLESLWPRRAMKLEIKAAGVAEKVICSGTPPKRRLRSLAVRANRLLARRWASLDL